MAELTEQNKKDLSDIAEAVNALPEKEQDRMVAFLQGAAFMAQAGNEKEGKDDE